MTCAHCKGDVKRAYTFTDLGKNIHHTFCCTTCCSWWKDTVWRKMK